tara:strand:+ start:1869 stop:2051 length:183 start_codon:yes stop_codon:yes gene_type:complete
VERTRRERGQSRSFEVVVIISGGRSADGETFSNDAHLRRLRLQRVDLREDLLELGVAFLL